MPSRVHLTLHQKRTLRAYSDAHNDLTQQDLSDWTYATWGKRVQRSTISKILSARAEQHANPDAKRKQVGRHAAMEARLFDWFLSVQSRSAISDAIIWAKANDLLQSEPGSPTVSLSWVSRFKQRNGIKLHKQHGEAGSADVAALEQQRKSLRDLLSQYSPADVFNMDESGLFFRMLPSQTLATHSTPGRKKDKARITVALCANMTSTEKLEPIVIAQHQNPRCMKGVDRAKLGVRYLANKKAWMTSKLFTDWLKSFNLSMCGRKVLLLVDNASCHVALDMTNVRLHFLPPNTTPYLQPMDAGIIKNFKLHYRHEFVRWTLDQLEASSVQKKMDVLTAVCKVVDAWRAVTADTIRSCWLHTGIVDGAVAAALRQESEPKRLFETSGLDNLIEKLQLNDPLLASEYIACDDSLEEWQEGDDIACEKCDSDDDDGVNQPLSHREAVAACAQLATYAFAHGIEGADVRKVAQRARALLLSSMRQASIRQFLE